MAGLVQNKQKCLIFIVVSRVRVQNQISRIRECNKKHYRSDVIKMMMVIKSGFWTNPKITFANLCKPIHGIINYSTSICPSESGKCGREGKKSQKIEYLENEKSFLDEIKNICHSFWRAVIWWKNKKLIRAAGLSTDDILLPTDVKGLSKFLACLIHGRVNFHHSSKAKSWAILRNWFFLGS